MTKEEMQKQIDRLHMLLGIAFTLIPAARMHVFFERAKELTEKDI